MNKRRRQWHLPFQNALQITLEKDEGHYELFPEVELTIIFVCFSYPKKLMAYLQAGHQVKETESGVYRICDAALEITIIVQSRLKGQEYLWLKNLSDCVSKEDFGQMAEQAYYRPEDKRRDELFQFIGENNKHLWQEGEKDMCKIFEEIEERGEKRGEMRGEKRGITKGERRSEDRFSNLMKILLKEERYKEIETVSNDRKALHEMYKRYGI